MRLRIILLAFSALDLFAAVAARTAAATRRAIPGARRAFAVAALLKTFGLALHALLALVAILPLLPIGPILVLWRRAPRFAGFGGRGRRTGVGRRGDGRRLWRALRTARPVRTAFGMTARPPDFDEGRLFRFFLCFSAGFRFRVGGRSDHAIAGYHRRRIRRRGDIRLGDDFGGGRRYRRRCGFGLPRYKIGFGQQRNRR